MGNARQAIADEASAAGSVDYSAATSGLEDVAGAATGRRRARPRRRGCQLGPVRGPRRARRAHVVLRGRPVHVDVRGPGGDRGGSGCDQGSQRQHRWNLVYQMGVSRIRRPGTTSPATRSSLEQLGTAAPGADGRAQIGHRAQATSAFAATPTDRHRLGQAMARSAAAQQDGAGARPRTSAATSGRWRACTASPPRQAVALAQRRRGVGQAAEQAAANAADAAMAKIEAYANANINAAGPGRPAGPGRARPSATTP